MPKCLYPAVLRQWKLAVYQNSEILLVIILYDTQHTLLRHPCSALVQEWKDPCRMDRAVGMKLTAATGNRL